MLVTIFNIPNKFTIKEVEELITIRCGLASITVENLVSVGNKQKATVRLSDEIDAANLDWKINGLNIDGEFLYVEDNETAKAAPSVRGRASDIVSPSIHHCSEPTPENTTQHSARSSIQDAITTNHSQKDRKCTDRTRYHHASHRREKSPTDRKSMKNETNGRSPLSRYYPARSNRPQPLRISRLPARSRSPSRFASRGPSKSHSYTRDRSRSQSRTRHRSRSQLRRRDRSVSQSRTRVQSGSQSRRRDRSGSQSRRRVRSRSHSRSHIRPRSQSRHRVRSRSQSRTRVQSGSQSRSRVRSGSRPRTKPCSRRRSRSSGRSGNRSQSKSTSCQDNTATTAVPNPSQTPLMNGQICYILVQDPRVFAQQGYFNASQIPNADASKIPIYNMPQVFGLNVPQSQESQSAVSSAQSMPSIPPGFNMSTLQSVNVPGAVYHMSNMLQGKDIQQMATSFGAQQTTIPSNEPSLNQFANLQQPLASNPEPVHIFGASVVPSPCPNPPPQPVVPSLGHGPRPALHLSPSIAAPIAHRAPDPPSVPPFRLQRSAPADALATPQLSTPFPPLMPKYEISSIRNKPNATSKLTKSVQNTSKNKSINIKVKSKHLNQRISETMTTTGPASMNLDNLLNPEKIKQLHLTTRAPQTISNDIQQKKPLNIPTQASDSNHSTRSVTDKITIEQNIAREQIKNEAVISIMEGIAADLLEPELLLDQNSENYLTIRNVVRTAVDDIAKQYFCNIPIKNKNALINWYHKIHPPNGNQSLLLEINELLMPDSKAMQEESQPPYVRKEIKRDAVLLIMKGILADVERPVLFSDPTSPFFQVMQRVVMIAVNNIESVLYKGTPSIDIQCITSKYHKLYPRGRNPFLMQQIDKYLQRGGSGPVNATTFTYLRYSTYLGADSK